MEYKKETLDALFNYGTEILASLQNISNDKDKKLEDANRRYKNLRESLQEILNKSNSEEEKF
mgnify:CR=1 FL=1